MTEPHDQEPTELHDDDVIRLRALLRDEPVEVDELVRERRLRAALDAAPAVAPVPAARRRAVAPWLTAAAAIVLVGLGGYLLVAVAGSGAGGDESADSSGAEVATMDSATGGSAAADDSASRDPAGADAADGAGEQLSTTTALAAESTAGPAPVTDLGEFPDSAALRARLAAPPDEELSSARSAPFVDVAATTKAVSDCVERQRASGAEVLAIASIDAEPIVVVRAETGIELLAIPSCAPRED